MIASSMKVSIRKVPERPGLSWLDVCLEIDRVRTRGGRSWGPVRWWFQEIIATGLPWTWEMEEAGKSLQH